MTLHRIYAADPTDTGRYTTRELTPTRVEIVRVEQERPVQRMTQPEYDAWQLAAIGEIAGQGEYIIGMPVNVARRSARRRQRVEGVIEFALVLTGIVVVVGALLWATGVLVNMFWTQ